MIDVDDEIFWRQVRKAYDQAVVDHNRTITVEVGTKSAEVFYDTNTETLEQFVAIDISEIAPNPLEGKLISPGEDDGRG